MRRTKTRIALVTCGSVREARRIAKALVQQRLVACVNIMLNPCESIYRWKGKVETAREYLLMLKTIGSRLSRVEEQVRSLHSYDVPEFIVVPVIAGSREYLDWVASSVTPAARTRK